MKGVPPSDGQPDRPPSTHRRADGDKANSIALHVTTLSIVDIPSNSSTQKELKEHWRKRARRRKTRAVAYSIALEVILTVQMEKDSNEDLDKTTTKL